MEKITFSRRWFLGAALCLAVAGAPVSAKENEDDKPEQGSSSEEIAALKARPLPSPRSVKVAILPFHDVSGSLAHVRMATVANQLIWQREGFEMLPLLSGFEALKKDKEIEPGQSLRKADALRLGKELGADWVVYGEVKELRNYTKTGLFKAAKYLIAGMRITVAEVESGEVLYWHARSDKTGGTGIGTNRKAETLKRRGAIIASVNSLKPFFEALPEHETIGELPGSEEVATTVNKLWPGDERDE
jgi:TolB-like protein